MKKFLLLCLLFLSTYLYSLEPINSYENKKFKVEVYDLKKEYAIRLYVPEDMSKDTFEMFLFNDREELEEDLLVVLPMKYWKDMGCFYVMVSKYYRPLEFRFQGKNKYNMRYFIGVAYFNRRRIVHTFIRRFYWSFTIRRG